MTTQRKPRRKVHNLLNAYYQIDEDGKQAPTAVPPLATDAGIFGGDGNADDAYGLNSNKNTKEKLFKFESNEFEATKWFNNVTKDKSVQKLVILSNELDDEIKNLDSELQMLVYENYSKFISATDIISNLNSTIKTTVVPKNLASLKSSMDNLNDLTANLLEDKLSKHNENLCELVKKRNAYEKIRMLLEVPAVLNQCLQNRDFNKASEVYCKTIAVLRRQREKFPDKFGPIIDEVDSIMSKLKESLESRVDGSKDLSEKDLISTRDAVNSSLTLLELNLDRKIVVEKFVKGREKALFFALKKCEEKIRFEIGSGDESAENSSILGGSDDALRTTCTILIEEFVYLLISTINGLKDLNADENNGLNSYEKFFADQVRKLCAVALQVLAKKKIGTAVVRGCLQSLKDEVSELSNHFPNLVENVFQDFFQEAALISARKNFAEMRSEMLKSVLNLHAELVTASNSSDDNKSEKQVEAVQNVEHSILLQACLTLTDCQPLTDLLINNSYKEKLLPKLLSEIGTQITSFFASLNGVCKIVAKTKKQNSAEFDKDTDPEIQELRSFEIQQIQKLPYETSFLLALVRISRQMEVRGVAKVWSVLSFP